MDWALAASGINPIVSNPIYVRPAKRMTNTPTTTKCRIAPPPKDYVGALPSSKNCPNISNNIQFVIIFGSLFLGNFYRITLVEIVRMEKKLKQTIDLQPN
jgi:hypothetical protein